MLFEAEMEMDEEDLLLKNFLAKILKFSREWALKMAVAWIKVFLRLEEETLDASEYHQELWDIRFHAFSGVDQDLFVDQMPFHIEGTCKVFLCCGCFERAFEG